MTMHRWASNVAGVLILGLISGGAFGQSAPVFTGPGGRPAISGDPIKLQEMMAFGASKQDAGGPIRISVVPPQDTTYMTGGLANGILLRPGNAITYCPVLSCAPGDHQRASALFWATTQIGGAAEEQTVAIQTIINKGQFRLWTSSTAYVAGDEVNIPAVNGVYQVVTPGTSAATGGGPSGTGSAIQDGTVVWRYINGAAINGKAGLYNEVQVLPGGGNSWAQIANLELSPGSAFPGQVVFTQELDISNNSGVDCSSASGPLSCIGLQIFVGGQNVNTAAISLAPNGIIGASGQGAALFGYFSNGAVSRLADIELDGGRGNYGVSIGDFVKGGVYQIAGFAEQSNSPRAFFSRGTRTIAAWDDQSAAPSGANLSGTYALAAVQTVNATAVNALAAGNNQAIVTRTADGSALVTTSRVDAGNVLHVGTKAASVTLEAPLVEASPAVPPSSTSPCTPGQHAWDSAYEYRCVAANTWKRAALSAW